MGCKLAYSVPNNTEVRMLENVLNKVAPQDLDIRLFSNNHTPSESDILGDYVEVSGGGYTLMELIPANWTIVAGDPSVATHTTIEWIFTGPLIDYPYGYYVTGRDTGELVWAESFNNGPYPVSNNGDKIRITPKLSLS